MGKRVLALTLCVFMILGLCTGCGDKTADQVFRFDIYAEPSSVDPQTASTDEEYLILLNTMEGLLKMDASGEIVPGAASGYTVSADGLTYTFTLRDGMVWSDGKTPVTAADFQFAFRRIFDPQTQSPSATDFLCIRGTSEALYGTTGSDSIGVSAPDEKTVVFSLMYANPSFLSLLTTPAALPCNEDFFRAARGKYGVSPEFLLYNGPFIIRKWEKGDYIHLWKNEDYFDADQVIPSAFRLYIKSESDLTRLTGGAVDAAAASYTDLEGLGEAGYPSVSFANILWSILPNTENPVLSNANIRQALAQSMNREALAFYYSENYQSATDLIPPAVTVNGKSYREAVADSGVSPAADYTAAELYQLGLRELALTDNPSLTIICPDSGRIPLLLSYLQRQWMDALGLFVNIEPLDADTLRSRISKRDYDLAVCSLKAAYDNPEAVLSQLVGEGSLTGWKSDLVEEQLSAAKRAATLEKILSSYRTAETEIVSQGVVLPLFYETSYYVTAPSVTGLWFSPFGCHVHFALGRKKG